MTIDPRIFIADQHLLKIVNITIPSGFISSCVNRVTQGYDMMIVDFMFATKIFLSFFWIFESLGFVLLRAFLDISNP